MRRLSRKDLLGVGMTSQRRRDALIERLRAKGVTDERVLSVMSRMPRHLFIDEALANRAYEDSALPIGYGQTISQPYVVARMTEAVLGTGEPPRRVLEIGTGSGYQAAILAMLVETVYTVERIEALYQQAGERFRSLQLDNIELGYSDGGLGWPEAAPFDAIVMTAAPQALPEALLEQLAPGGRLVGPVGGRRQQLIVVERNESGDARQALDDVNFVPLIPGKD